MYQEIIEANAETITDLYFNKHYRKTEIAYKLITDLKLNIPTDRADSFRRAISDFISKKTIIYPVASIGAKILNDTPTEHVDKYPQATRTRAKILLLDTETAPLIVASWGIRKQHLNIDQIISDSHLICWAGKWLFDTVVFGDCVTSEEAIAKDDRRICMSLWEAMDQADIIIAHNGRNFDIPVINSRFFVNKFPSPPSPYEIVDTLLSSRQAFRLSSHKLDFINRISGLTVKLKTDFQLWLDCMNGVPEKLLQMFTYCKNDTSILEETYMEMRQWIKAHPNMAFYVESEGLICPTCGCTELEERGTYHTTVNEYVSYHCPKCGSYGRSRLSATSVEKKKSVLVSLGR